MRTLGLLAIGSLVLTPFACGSGNSGSGGNGGSAGAGPGGATTASSQGGSAPTASGGSGGGTGGSLGTGGSANASGGAGGAGGAGGGSGTVFAMGTICNDSAHVLTPPATLKHVIVFLFENENLGSVNGNANAPYMSSIADDCGYAKNFADNCFSSNLPSLPHYLALTSGSNCSTGLNSRGTGCITDDGDATAHELSSKSIFQQVASWRSYQEGMPSACDRSSGGRYACKHNPAAYYNAIQDCASNDIAIAAITCSSSAKNTPCTAPDNAFTEDLANDTLPAYAFVTPNLDNDMHDGTVTQGDNWFATYLPLILGSKAYLNGEVVVFALWDEQSTASFNGATPNFFVSPYITKGTASATQMNLFAALRATEKALGISTFLGCASGTQPGGGSCPAGSTVDVRAAIGF